MKESVPTFNIREIFQQQEKYVIPIYQRNYAWGESQINQLIQDIYDYSTKETLGNYYIGTLVVFERIFESETVYETIDGQQRLTTLNIVISALHREFSEQLDGKINYQFNLTFDVRKKSTDTLAVICSNSKELNYISTKDYNTKIQQAYQDATKTLKKLLDTNDKIESFYSFLVGYVRIMRVSVPEDTNLNHYFEIMNNRGEQLEKHEIIKARMLNVIHEDKAISYTFNLIWEACSDMERYVQYGFNVGQRRELFGRRLYHLKANDIDKVSERIYEKGKEKIDSTSNEMSFEDITKYSGSFQLNSDHKDDVPERFNSIINFSNFLLHVLRIQTEKDISLDDKRLIEFFEKELKSKEEEEKKEFVKTFGFNLLKCKFLFDKYIIKREFIRDRDQWSLKKMKRYDRENISYVNTFGDEEREDGLNKSILMLLSMFHVSAPTLVYKHWLNAALFFLFKNPNPTENEYYNYLKNLANSFLYDRYLSKADHEIEYYDITYKNDGVSINQNKPEELDYGNLDNGVLVENFIFNFLDFILWEKEESGYSNFEFTFRSSVEHYYPQNPISAEHKISSEIYDLFGNLCLISRSKNSRLSNHMPAAKKDYYIKTEIADSLKLKSMMKLSDWTEKEIREEGKKMKETLINYN